MACEWKIVDKYFNNQEQLEKVHFQVFLQETVRDREFVFTENLGFDLLSEDADILSHIQENLGLGQKQALEDGIEWEVSQQEQIVNDESSEEPNPGE